MIPSNYRVAASCFEPDAAQTQTQRRTALHSHLVELLASQAPDLLVLPETVIAVGFGEAERCGAEQLDGETVAMAAKLAAAHHANICVPIIEVDGGILFNTAVYVDRSGKIAGTYRKQVPTSGETGNGIHPGGPAQSPVILDGLRLGTSICFDQNFPDQIWHWIATGIDLLVFPAYTYAGNLMRSWAVNCGVPLVCAFPWESVIYDRDGKILAEAGTETSTVRFGFHLPWIACTLNLRSRIYHLDFNQERLKEIASRYGANVDVRLMVKDGRMMLTALGDNPSLEQVEKDLALVPLQKYLQESRELSIRMLKRN